MSWGNKLLITFIVFAAGMVFLVYRSMTTNYEMVEKDYYKKELQYQQVIDGSTAANQLTGQVAVSQDEKGIHLQLPAEMKNKILTGEVWFYCAYDAKKDQHFSLQTNNEASQSLALTQVPPGTYTIKLNWKAEEKSYYAEKSVTIL